MCFLIFVFFMCFGTHNHVSLILPENYPGEVPITWIIEIGEITHETIFIYACCGPALSDLLLVFIETEGFGASQSGDSVTSIPAVFCLFMHFH